MLEASFNNLEVFRVGYGWGENENNKAISRGIPLDETNQIIDDQNI